MVGGILLRASANQTSMEVVVPTTLTLAAPSQVSVGVPFQVSGNLSTTPGSTPISGATIQVIFGNQSVNVVTDSNGDYVANLTAPSTTGNDLVTADFLGFDGYMGSTASATVQVTAAVATSLTLQLSSTTVAPGQVITASGTLTRQDTGAGVPGQPIALTMDGTSVGSTTTDSSGNYSMQVTAPSIAGTHTVGASFAGADPPAEMFTTFLYADAMAPMGMRASAPWIPVGAAALLVGVGVLALAARRRR